jgi:hypothetical protein
MGWHKLLLLGVESHSDPPRKGIKKLESILSWLRSHSATRSYCQLEKDIKRMLCELFKFEEIMSRQRSLVELLQAGDHNTSFFQARATRRRVNKIKYLL